MRLRTDSLRHYVSNAPLPLAFERAVECRLYQGRRFVRPVLDLGCGDGLFAAALFAEPVDTGVDPDASELRRAERAAAYVELVQCYGDDIPKPDGSFQTAFSNSVLEHIEQLEPVLREVRRVLAPGGRFYVTVPSERFDEYSVVSQVLGALGLRVFQRRWRRFYNRFWKHYHFYSPEKWSEMMEAAGFEVVECFRYNPRTLCTVNDALAPFSFPSLVIKRTLGRWVLAPRLRHFLMAPARRWAQRALDGAERDDNGGLVFLELSKPI